MSLVDLQPLPVAAVCDRLAAHEFKGWFYGDSIGFEGLVAAADFLKDGRWIDFSHGFFRAWATRRHPFQPDDNTAPGHVMCEMLERTGDEVLREAVLDLAHHLRSRRKIGNVSVTFEDTLRSLRQPYGGIELSKEQRLLMQDPGAGVWLDCMHFDAPFYAHLSRIDPQGGWDSIALEEILAYRALLFDEVTGTYCHYWLEKLGRAQIPGWGRGQGWALLGMLDVLKFCGNLPRAHELTKQAQSLAARMADYQLSNGNWHCMVHEPRSGPEASTAAFMATAFFRGMKQGTLPRSLKGAADKAFDAMVSNLDKDGNLRGVSAAVMSALVDEHYWNVPLDRIVPWGQGPVLTAIAAREAFYT